MPVRHIWYKPRSNGRRASDVKTANQKIIKLHLLSLFLSRHRPKTPIADFLEIYHRRDIPIPRPQPSDKRHLDHLSPSLLRCKRFGNSIAHPYEFGHSDDQGFLLRGIRLTWFKGMKDAR